MAALRAVGGYEVLGALGRGDDLGGAAAGADLVVIATPDAAVAPTAEAIAPSAATVVAHLSGSLGLDVLAPHPRRAALHPLVPLPDPETGAARLASGASFAVAGDPLVRSVVLALGGRVVGVDDSLPGRLPRRRHHRGQPRGRAAGPGGTGGGRRPACPSMPSPGWYGPRSTTPWLSGRDWP